MAVHPLVRCERISKHFGEGETRVDALRDVSLEIYPRQVVALLGPSGCVEHSQLSAMLSKSACFPKCSFNFCPPQSASLQAGCNKNGRGL